MSRLMLLLSLSTIVIAASCTEEDNHVDPPGPFMTGVWDITWGGVPSKGKMRLNQNEYTGSGQVWGYLIAFSDSLQLHGEVSAQNDVLLETYKDVSLSLQKYKIEGRTSAERDTFTGTMEMFIASPEPAQLLKTFEMSATKR